MNKCVNLSCIYDRCDEHSRAEKMKFCLNMMIVKINMVICSVNYFWFVIYFSSYRIWNLVQVIALDEDYNQNYINKQHKLR